MIILRDVPFDRRAKFLYDSMAPCPALTELAEALERLNNSGDGRRLAEGLKAHHALLKRIYADTNCVEGKDDDDRYLSLVHGVTFLYAIFAHGLLVRKDDQTSVRIDKARLKQIYRKGNLTQRKRLLEHHGFAIGYLQGEDTCVSLSKASRLTVAYDGHHDLVPALKLFAEELESLDPSGPQPAGPQLSSFLRGNYGVAIMGQPSPRDSMDPLQVALLNTIDAYRQPWTELVNRFREDCGLQCSGFWTHGGTPAWSVSFSAKGKRPLAIFTLGADIVFIEFTLPVETAEAIILARKSYADGIREGIEAFHCVKCPKACKGSNLIDVDGVSLCTGRAEARRIYVYLRTPEDFASIQSMLDIIGNDVRQ